VVPAKAKEKGKLRLLRRDRTARTSTVLGFSETQKTAKEGNDQHRMTTKAIDSKNKLGGGKIKKIWRGELWGKKPLIGRSLAPRTTKTRLSSHRKRNGMGASCGEKRHST